MISINVLTIEDLNILQSDPVRRAVEANLDADPARVALDKHIPHPRLVAQQVKYLQRARTKLPSYYNTRCILPPIAFEQSSSEATAAHKDYSGGLCLDLTCGLGVDSLWLSKRFDRVVAVERDPVLAEVSRINFRLLGITNIIVENCDAAEALEKYAPQRPDLIYLDPNRRSAEGKKVVSLADCSPDAAALLPVMRAAAEKIVVKLSPIFDVDEVFRIFGQHTVTEVVSLGGECKEVLVETGEHIDSPVVKATGIGLYSVEMPYIKGTAATPQNTIPTDFSYLIVPDVALAKARIAVRHFPVQGAYIESDNSFAFSNDWIPESAGKIRKILSAEPYSARKLKKSLAAAGIRRLTILKRDFPLSTERILRELSIGEGGQHTAAFTTMAGRLWVIFLE